VLGITTTRPQSRYMSFATFGYPLVKESDPAVVLPGRRSLRIDEHLDAHRFTASRVS
jgi:hypothetical protein